MAPEQRIRQAQQCTSIDEVRLEIDRIDRALVKLLSERQRYIERAAEIKSNRSSIRDEARISDVLSKVLAQARRAGLSPNVAEPVWRILMERSIALEMEAFEAKVQRAR
jgi:isochorismate pyruvate lyase